MQRDAVLDPGLVAEAPPVVEVDAVRHVLLTGATGFLGAFVLRELQRRTSAHVTCVVRARDAGHGLQRLRDSLKRYVLAEDIEGKLYDCVRCSVQMKAQRRAGRATTVV